MYVRYLLDFLSCCLRVSSLIVTECAGKRYYFILEFVYLFRQEIIPKKSFFCSINSTFVIKQFSCCCILARLKIRLLNHESWSICVSKLQRINTLTTVLLFSIEHREWQHCMDRIRKRVNVNIKRGDRNLCWDRNGTTRFLIGFLFFPIVDECKESTLWSTSLEYSLFSISLVRSCFWF